MDTSNIEVMALAAFASITKEDCQGWISHCNIYGQQQHRLQNTSCIIICDMHN